MGTLEVRVTDAPPEGVSKILITVSNIEVNSALGETEAGWQSVVSEIVSFDLVEVSGIEELLGSSQLQPGPYNQLRLSVVEALITIQGEERTATVPSGKLRLVGAFDLVAGETTVLTLDFDAERSVVLRGRLDPLLKPVVKLLVRQGDQPLSEARPASVLEGLTPPPDPESLLKQVAASMAALESFHMEVEAVAKTGEETEDELMSFLVEGEFETDGDNRVRLIVDIKAGVFAASFDVETRTVDGITYSENPFTGEWEIGEDSDFFDSEDLPGLDFFGPDVAEELVLENMTVEIDILEGTPVYRITGTIPDEPEVEQAVVWVGIDDLLIRQMQLEGSTRDFGIPGLAPGDIEEVFLSVLFRLSGFNEPVEVEVPEGVATPEPVERPVTTSTYIEGVDVPEPAETESQFHRQEGAPIRYTTGPPPAWGGHWPIIIQCGFYGPGEQVLTKSLCTTWSTATSL